MSKIVFKKLVLRNFMSFGNKNTEVNLDVGDVALVLGKNLDIGSEGYSRNGVGKSTMLQAIVWCLFDQGIDNIKKDDFINITNKKDMLVKLFFDLDEQEYQIIRGRKPNKMEIKKNGEPFTLDSVKNNDEAIEVLLGFDYDIFMNTIMLSSNVSPFLKMKGADQKAFIEKFMSLDIIAERASNLKSMKKEVVVDINLEEQNKINHTDNYDNTMTNLNNLVAKKDSWDQTHNTNKQNTINQIEEYMAVDIDSEIEKNAAKEKAIKNIEVLDTKIKDLMVEKNTHVERLEAVKNEKLRDVDKQYSDKLVVMVEEKTEAMKRVDVVRDKALAELSDKKDSLNVIGRDIDKTNTKFQLVLKDIDSIETEVDALDKGVCHSCNQSFTSPEREAELASKLIELFDQQNVHTAYLEPLVVGEKVLKEEIDEMKTSIEKTHKNDVSKINDHHDNNFNKHMDLKQSDIDVVNEIFTNDYESYSTKNDQLLDKHVQKKAKISFDEPIITHDECIQLKTEIKNLEEKLEQIKKEHNPYVDQMMILSKDLVKYDDTKLKEMCRVDEHYKILIKMLTDSKSHIRKSLIDQYIPFINQKLSGYLEALESPHKVQINSDLTVDIEYMMKSISYGNLSNGEKLRVNFAVSLAFRDFNELSGKSCNILAIDELLDNGLDGAGFYNVFKLLKSIPNRSVFIISHRDELIAEVDRVINVVKEKGFSRIEV